MKSPTEKEIIKRYGQLIVDFTNAESTDEACFSFFEHIQKLLSFSPAFLKQIERIFPTYHMLSDKEKNLPRYGYGGHSGREFIELNWPCHQIIDCHHSIKRYQDECKEILERIIKGDRLHEIQTLKEYMEIYNGLPKGEISFSDGVDGNAMQLVPVPRFRESEYLDVNESCDPPQLCGPPQMTALNLYDSDTNEVIDSDLFDLYEDMNHFQGFLLGRPLELFVSKIKEGLAYFTIGFFKVPESYRYIGECQQCDSYFIAGKNDKRIKYCKKCSPKNKMTRKERQKYQKKYMAQKKREKEKDEKQEYINRLMKAGYTNEEAEQEYSEFLKGNAEMQTDQSA